MSDFQNGRCLAYCRALAMALVVTFVGPTSAETIDPNKNYTYLYFENGYPTRMDGVGYLLNALLDLDQMLENPKGEHQLINWQ